MERVFSRLPEDWNIKMERQRGEKWFVMMQRPNGMQHHETADSLIEALEEVWRALR